MRKTLLLLTTALCLLGCDRYRPKDPVRESLISVIIQATGADEDKVYITDLHLVDSTTYGEELAVRRYLLAYKAAVNESHRAYYAERGSRRAANLYAASVAKDRNALEGLDSLKVSLGEKLEEVAYYEFVYSAQASSPDTKYIIQDWHFLITPRYHIIAMKQTHTGIARGLGKIIPGYLTVLGENEISEEEMEVYRNE